MKNRTQCPNTKVVLSGYSQGGQLVHKAAKQLSAAVAAKVSSGMFVLMRESFEGYDGG